MQSVPERLAQQLLCYRRDPVCIGPGLGSERGAAFVNAFTVTVADILHSLLLSQGNECQSGRNRSVAN